MDKNGKGFWVLKRKFPKLSEAKIKKGVFQGLQIRQLMLDCDFEKSLTNIERQTCLPVKTVINNFLGNRKSKNYKHLVNIMLQNFQEMKVNMSLKIHIVHSHLNFSPENLGAVSDEHGERFHKDIAEIEKSPSRNSETHFNLYCWDLDECLLYKFKSVKIYWLSVKFYWFK